MLDVAALYTEHALLIRNYLRRHGRGQFSDDDVDDLVQGVFERACRAAPRFQDRGAPVAAWLVRIARNLLIDERQRKRLPVVQIRAGLDIAAFDPDPSEPTLSLDVLTPEQRAVLVLRYGEDLTLPEVGARLGIPYETAKCRHRQAIRTLRRTRGAA